MGAGLWVLGWVGELELKSWGQCCFDVLPWDLLVNAAPFLHPSAP